MPKSNRTTVRPVPPRSILDKKFKKVIPVAKRVKLRKSHPYVVLEDLKRGSLTSLAEYMRETGGIADPEISLALLNLIDGTIDETAFRILVIDHPDKSSEKGGRPKTRGISMSETEVALALRFDEALKIEKKHDLALTVVSSGSGVSRSTVSRALRKRETIKQQMDEEAARQLRLADTVQMYQEALFKLKAKSEN